MKIDPNKFYLMPLIMGPINDQGKPPNGIYREFQCLSIQYETDTDAIQALLPDCYQPTENPLVTAMFGYYDGVDFMAGRGYRIASFCGTV
jgi:acetoacetate decarboxylase